MKPVKEKLDISSLEAFPTLGSAPAAAVAAASAWGGATVIAAGSAKKTNGKPSAARSSQVSENFSFTVSPQFRNRATFTEIFARAKERSGVTSIESSTSRSLSTTFIVKGKPDAIVIARRELVRGLTAKITETILVPSSVRAFIIGAGGRTLKQIQQASSTKIQVQKRDASEEATPEPEFADGEEPSTEVTVEGDIDGVAIAKTSIMAIVAERTKNLTTRLQISPDHVPYVAAQATSLEEGKDIKIKMPTAFAESETVPYIVISGERNAVQETKAAIQQTIENLQRTYVSASTAVPKRQHKYVMGESGSTLSEIFDQTGCIVKVPSPENPSEVITVLGPREKLVDAIGLVMARANSVIVDQLEVWKAHGRNRNHACDLARYFNASKRLHSIEKENDVQIMIPDVKELVVEPTPEVVFDIAGKSEPAVKKARKQIVELVNSIPPNRVSHITDIDPLLFRHIGGFKNKNIEKVKEQFGVVAVVPSEGEGLRDIILLYEGKDDDEFGPDETEVESCLESAKLFFEDVKAKQATLVTKVLSVPAKQHKFIIGPKRSTINALSGEGQTVSIQFGEQSVDVAEPLTEDSVVIRGPADEVASVAEKIVEIVDEASNQEVLGSFSVTFEFPTKFSSQLIGKGGANISKYRDELGVKVGLADDGNVTIKGVKSNVLEAETRIKALAARLADEVVLRLSIPNEYHSSLIGQKGKLIKRLEERYGVRVNFPRSSDSEDTNGESSEFLPKNKDDIVLRGPSKGAAKAKEELMDLYKYDADHGHSSDLAVPRQALSRIIGKNGEYINDIMDTTGAKVDIPRNVGEADTVSIALSGTEEAIKQAKLKIKEIVDEFESLTSETIDVPKKYHRSLIGKSGATLRDIVVSAGGPDDSSQLHRIVRIPHASSTDTAVVVQGHRDLVAKIIAEIERRVGELESRVESTIEIPLEKHRFIVGPGGMTRRAVEAEFGVTLSVPKPNTTKDVTVEGPPAAVEAAKAKLIELTTPKPRRGNSRASTASPAPAPAPASAPAPTEASS
ncbi:hypothetical protein V1512DRAFT_201772 [Lipomyces arxii]|uniref:uncharacterized protein n=1 Tax=Lipomyces arxii TaxID=56418 RepID=UPI0034CDF8E7